MCKKWLCLLLFLFLGTAAWALPLEVKNFGFEAPYTEGVSQDDVNDWNKMGNGPQFNGVAYFPDFPATEEFQWGWIRSHWTYNPNQGLNQTLEAVWGPGTYTLTVDAANYPGNTQGGNKKLDMIFFAGDLLNELIREQVVLSNEPNTYSISITLGETDPAIGQAVGIHFSNHTNHGQGRLVIDNVRVEAPDPSLVPWNPMPINEDVTGELFPLLSWTPGFKAAQSLVAIDESYDDVAGGIAQYQVETTEPNLLIGVEGAPFPGGLVPGVTYYWQVIDSNDAAGEGPWAGPIWSFMVLPKTAQSPTPEDGELYVDPNILLSWNPGVGAIEHFVTIGTDRQAVMAAAVGSGTATSDPNYHPGTDVLERGKTYYWRVDENDGVSLFVGTVWSFTTRELIEIANPDLVGAWPLDEGEGVVAVDVSGHDNYGALTDTGVHWTAGVFGGGLYFDGEDGRVNAGYQDGLATFTISAWVKSPEEPNLGDQTGPIMRMPNFAFMWHHSVANARGALTFQSGGFQRVQFDTLEADTWYHLTGTYDGTTVKTYTNGKLSNSADFLDIDLTGGDLLFGGGGSISWNGSLDDVKVFSQALSGDEILEIMRGDPLLAWAPNPANGSTVDVRIAELSWRAGDDAVKHDLYYGTERDVVAGGTPDSGAVYKGRLDGTQYSIDAVEAGRRYFWRVDEIAADGTVTEGLIWSFQVTDEYLIIDGFENYTTEEGSADALWNTWLSGFDNLGTTLGASISDLETNVANDGFQSLVLGYSHFGFFQQLDGATVQNMFFSKVQREFETAQNWAQDSGLEIGSLRMFVRGREENNLLEHEVLFVEITDASGVMDRVLFDDPNLVNQAGWKSVEVDLTALSLDTTQVKTLAIGVGDPTNTTTIGSGGEILVDDVRLYALVEENGQ